MKVPRYQLAKIMSARTLGKSDPQTLSREIAAYLLAEGRTYELDSLLRDIMELRAEKGIMEVRAVSAFDLTPDLISEVREEVQMLYPNAAEIIISPTHDASVLSGVRLVFPNQLLDLSARAKLSRFKQLTTSGRN